MNREDDSIWLTGCLALLALVYALIYQLMAW
jgi:hypothetical protein